MERCIYDREYTYSSHVASSGWSGGQHRLVTLVGPIPQIHLLPASASFWEWKFVPAAHCPVCLLGVANTLPPTQILFGLCLTQCPYELHPATTAATFHSLILSADLTEVILTELPWGIRAHMWFESEVSFFVVLAFSVFIAQE